MKFYQKLAIFCQKKRIILIYRSQESGVRSQESGVRSQESGVRRQEAEEF
ncbi:hypothetical protein IQ227_06795 [Anabaena aphanizomenioides LEGE 00250]|uniref:Uncharacterized protein n=1 Tax=Sphaerospermopsis aphanizomenoides LEGE 00250 TaxID=2777972 RepID=A0ABR9VB92_9CYAN|nr:hypothetical protein [Sphaerospermopsis aphanizomenoides]MBE9235751.1 hypothetical protein [Sphaerospermopsis aphanizomenoides LEGE 00250]